jgi:flagellar motor switch protein FliN/FliY
MTDESTDGLDLNLDGLIDNQGKVKNEEDSSSSEDISSQSSEDKTKLEFPQRDELTQNLRDNKNLDMILDIPLVVTVELGRTKMLINDLLQLGQGSVIELSKLVGEPLEILINEKLVARGEVVVVHEKFGVRLTDIVSPLERIESLGS